MKTGSGACGTIPNYQEGEIVGSLRAHGAGYQIRYYQDGQRHYEQFTTLEEAEARLFEIDLSKKRGLTVDSKPHTVRFEELAAAVVNHYIANDHRSTDDIEARYRVHLLPVFGKRKAIAITTSNINAYIAHRKRQKAATGTINRELEALKRAFNLGLKSGTVASKPYIPMLREDNVRQGFFTREEVDRLILHMPADLGRMVLFGFLTGWRLGEIQRLEWSNVDFGAREIRLEVGTTKNRGGRLFPFTTELQAILKAERKPFGRVFRQGAFKKTWATACDKAGLPCVVTPYGKHGGKKIKALRTFHDLRRSAAREMSRAGVPERVIMELMGWKTRSVFDRYRIVSESDLREAVKKLESGSR